MMAIACPSCGISMQIEEHEPATEWECPSCAAALLVHGIHAERLDVEIRQPGHPTPSTHVEAPPHDPEIKDEVYVHALECLLKGQKPRDVRRGLIDAGHSAKQADRVLQTALKYQRQGQLSKKIPTADGVNPGARNMMVGAIVFLVGIFITFGSLTVAANVGSSKYVFAWGGDCVRRNSISPQCLPVNELLTAV